MTIQTINPSTGKIIKSYEEMSDQEVITLIDKCHEAFLGWRKTSFADRAAKMQAIAQLLRARKKEYAKLIATEMGKPIKAGEAEIEKCAWVCEHFAEQGEHYLNPRIVKTELHSSYVTYRPLGVIFAIMPWNFPFWQVFRFAAPTIMAGNTVLLKHAPITTGAGLAIEQLFRDTDFPANLFRTVILNNNGAAKVIENPQVAGVTLTGSVNAGKVVGSLASKALKKSVLELGGSDPYVILEDADLEIAAEACVTSRMSNSGQVCIAVKRIIAVTPILKDLQHLALEKIQRYKMGDPSDENINFGPLARQDIRDTVHRQVQKTIAMGATLVSGGDIPNQPGFYYPPTILTNIKKGMPAYEEEIFGPVLAFIEAKDERDAIQIANDTQYGLAAAVFTKNIKHGEKLAVDEIHAGTCGVNTHIASDPRLPFGGIKNSGYGRELSQEGIRSFVNVKTISIK